MKEKKKKSFLGKRGGAGGKAVIVLLVLVVAGLAGIGYTLWSKPSSGGNELTIVSDGGSYASGNCPDTRRYAYFKAVDTFAATTTQVSGTVHVMKGDVDIAQATLNSTTGAWSTGVQLCGEKYKAVLFTSAGSVASAQKDFAVGSGDDARITLETNQLAPLTTTVAFDDTNPSTAAYQFSNGGTTTNSTSFTALNGTNVATDAADTAKAIGADGVLRYTITAHSNTAKYSFGDAKADFKTYFCIRGQATNSVWDFTQASVTIDGIAATAVSPAHEPSSNAGSYVKLSEACYDTKTSFFSTNDHTIKVVLPTMASQNPGTSDDIINYFLPEGLYQSVQSATRDQPMTGIYTDATTKVLVGTASGYDPVLTVQVS